MKKQMTPRELANLAGVSRQSVYKAIRKGSIKHTTTQVTQIVINQNECEKYISSVHKSNKPLNKEQLTM
jgi:excisionase family DNA binding protein